jgi:phosphotransferase system HPr (HPr) family protein
MSAGARSDRASARVVLPNERGLHARPCSAIVALALAHRSALEVACGGTTADGRSILSLMTLAAPHGAELEFRARGEDAEELVRGLVALVRAGFDEQT